MNVHCIPKTNDRKKKTSIVNQKKKVKNGKERSRPPQKKNERQKTY